MVHFGYSLIRANGIKCSRRTDNRAYTDTYAHNSNEHLFYAKERNIQQNIRDDNHLISHKNRIYAKNKTGQFTAEYIRT